MSLIRLDNAFPIPSSFPYTPIPSPPSNQDAILSAFQQTSLTPLLNSLQQRNEKLTERNLYRFMFLRDEKEGMNWEITRYQFHCFLRWVGQRGNMFRLERDGRVEILKKERGSSSESQRGEGNAGLSRSGSRRGGGRRGPSRSVSRRGEGGAGLDGSRRGEGSAGPRQGWTEIPPGEAVAPSGRKVEDDAKTYAGTVFEDFIGR